MHAEPYHRCRDCGERLERTTMYRRHAYCGDCAGIAATRADD